MNQTLSKAKLLIKSNPHLAAAIAILILLRIPSLFEGFWYGDEGIYAAIAHALHHGQTLYIDVWDHKPPLLYWLYYLVGFGGDWHIGLVLIKLLGLVASVFSLVFLRSILKQLFSSKLAQISPLYICTLLLGLPYLEPNTANAEVFFIPVNLAILVLLLKRTRLILVGLLLGISLLIKFHSFFEASLVILFTSLLHQFKYQQSWREWFNAMLRIATGLASVIIPYLAYTLFQGNTADMLNAIIWYNLGYTDDAQSSLQLFGLSLSLSKMVLATAVALLAALYYLYRQAKIGLTLGIVLIILLSEYAVAIVSGRPYAHYALQVIPGAVIGLGYALHRQVEVISWRKCMPAIAVILIGVGLWFGFTRGQNLASLVTPQDYYPKFVQSFITHSQPRAFTWRYGYEIPRYQQLARHINTHYPQSHSYYFYGNRPWLFTQINKEFTNTYLFWFHVGQNPVKDRVDRQAADLLLVDPEVEHAESIVADADKSWELKEVYEGIEIYTNK